MMGWLRLGGDVTASDYLLDSDRMAGEVYNATIRYIYIYIYIYIIYNIL